MDDEATAREKLEKAGFDPDDVNAFKTVERPRSVFEIPWKVNPMIHFCSAGDLKMCRYLLSKGASTTALCPDNFWFPMYAAAIRTELQICKWLYKNGAEEHIRKRNESSSPIGVASGNAYAIHGDVHLVLWMILKGAISHENYPHNIDIELAKKDLLSTRNQCDNASQLVNLTGQYLENHQNFFEFLKGTLSLDILQQRLRSSEAADMLLQMTPQDQYLVLWEKLNLPQHQSILQCLCGKVGILDKIAKFVGVPRVADLCGIRHIDERLPQIIADHLKEQEMRDEIRTEIEREFERRQRRSDGYFGSAANYDYDSPDY